LQIRQPGQAAVPPSPLWTRRAAAGIARVNPTHADFPALLAEALDTLEACGQQLPQAAGLLGVTTSQLMKFLQVEPAAWEYTNRCRQQRGLPRLK
jgi:hypothetical protein